VLTTYIRSTPCRRWIIIGLVVFTLVLLGAITGLAYGVAILAKDTDVGAASRVYICRVFIYSLYIQGLHMLLGAITGLAYGVAILAKDTDVGAASRVYIGSLYRVGMSPKWCAVVMCSYVCSYAVARNRYARATAGQHGQRVSFVAPGTLPLRPSTPRPPEWTRAACPDRAHHAQMPETAVGYCRLLLVTRGRGEALRRKTLWGRFHPRAGQGLPQGHAQGQGQGLVRKGLACTHAGMHTWAGHAQPIFI
jgi:hypothetical protein